MDAKYIVTYLAKDGTKTPLIDAAVERVAAGEVKLAHQQGAQIMPLLKPRATTYANGNATCKLLLGTLGATSYFFWDCQCGGRSNPPPALFEV